MDMHEAGAPRPNEEDLWGSVFKVYINPTQYKQRRQMHTSSRFSLVTGRGDYKEMSFFLADQQRPRIWAQMPGGEGGGGLRGLSQWVHRSPNKPYLTYGGSRGVKPARPDNAYRRWRGSSTRARRTSSTRPSSWRTWRRRRATPRVKSAI